MRDFFRKRYGVDQLNKFLLGVAIACVILNWIFRSSVFYILGMIALILCYFRMFSTHYGKRMRENEAFRNVVYSVQQKLKPSDYHIYRCPRCGQKIRIPRGKGRVSIHCPKCGNDFIKRS